MKHSKWFFILVLVLLAALLTPIRARADVAPPEQPPGANIVPGSESTQVRMVAETVTLTVLSQSRDQHLAQADTVADFTMRNLGTETETMQARFPLTFAYPPDENDGFGNLPEITDIRIFVNGKQVSTNRIDDGVPAWPGGVAYRQRPWAAFDVSFPPATDVNVTVKYTSNGFGDPGGANATFRYVLETGAAWNGTIGSADIIVKLPYAATLENVPPTERMGLPHLTTVGMQMLGDTLRWHFDDFEPTTDNNISVTLVSPSFWQKVLDGRAQTQKNPNDGEAWGQLGKAIKEVSVAAKGYPRDDEAGFKLYDEAEQAYQKSVTLLPKDALWHYGFADLLWRRVRFMDRNTNKPLDMARVSHLVDELRQSLALDPKNQKAKDLADQIADQYEYPWAIVKTDSGYDFPVLTATPTANPETATPTPEATSTSQEQIKPTQTLPSVVGEATYTPVSPAKTPKAGLPLCGGAELVFFPALAAFWLVVKRKSEPD